MAAGGEGSAPGDEVELEIARLRAELDETRSVVVTFAALLASALIVVGAVIPYATVHDPLSDGERTISLVTYFAGSSGRAG